MKRRTFLKSSGLAGVAFTASAPAVIAQSGVRWRLAHSFPRSLDTVFGGAEIFAALVRDMTGGRFEISVHGPGELVPPFGVLDAAQNGTVECTHTASNFFAGKDETFALNGIPFGMNSRQLLAWQFEGNGLELMRDFYADYNVINFPMGNTGAQMGGWYREEIGGLDDIKGLKLRVSGLLSGRVYERLGMVPQSIPGGEIYQSLEKGTIDAVELSGPYDDEKLGFHKVARNYYFPGWHDGSPQIDLFVNLDAYNALPDDYKEIVAAAASQAHLRVQARYDALNPPALRRLVAGGAVLRRFPAEIIEAALREAQDVYAEIAASNPRFAAVFEDYRSFQQDQDLWFGVAEASLDRINQARR